jgi:hypothetical protein
MKFSKVKSAQKYSYSIQQSNETERKREKLRTAGLITRRRDGIVAEGLIGRDAVPSLKAQDYDAESEERKSA